MMVIIIIVVVVVIIIIVVIIVIIIIIRRYCTTTPARYPPASSQAMELVGLLPLLGKAVYRGYVAGCSPEAHAHVRWCAHPPLVAPPRLQRVIWNPSRSSLGRLWSRRFRIAASSCPVSSPEPQISDSGRGPGFAPPCYTRCVLAWGVPSPHPFDWGARRATANIFWETLPALGSYSAMRMLRFTALSNRASIPRPARESTNKYTKTSK